MNRNTFTPSVFFSTPLRRGAANGLLFALLALGGCTPLGLAVGAGAATGVAAYEERGVDGAARDLRITGGILDLWLRADYHLPAEVGLEVYDGRAMLTGQVHDEKIRTEAVALAWKVDGVRDVINDIIVTDKGSLLDTARDSWITAQLKTELTFDKSVMAINYAIETVGGTVYMIGIAQNQGELDRVLAHARSIAYVRAVVNHVRIKRPS
ncbi:BON domain-containing protein [Varunaivibrio sulfuroxidans]|uniref:Osmotically-inducible protein OsmY n=1 Tax=Varunaivibrio sulfuroxidans TaxID=1773489 RepID=A0A4R3JG82_9PROT|nr:BON domain-containing protein [Varunaivibrio sulfuroxidans]TCS64902.1 osmotically-inducible protein OsmY [Varunaivibrio sulfuroxidans]WES29804.1 BON domain-containing protein [Varunaivibrio sulfuroxidans]